MNQILGFDFQKPSPLEEKEKTWGLDKKVGKPPEEQYLSLPSPNWVNIPGYW